MIEKIITGDLEVNTYLFNYKDNLAVIIDPGSDAEKIIDAVNRKELSIKGILLTHGHFDHIGAVSDIKNRYNVPVYIHNEDSSFLGSSGLDKLKEMFNYIGGSLDYYIKAYYKETPEADQLLSDNNELEEFGLKVIHTPGHSPGSCCFYAEKAGLMFTGDTLFNGGIGRTDFVGGNYNTLMQSLKKLKNYPENTKIYPGHGSSSYLKHEV